MKCLLLPKHSTESVARPFSQKHELARKCFLIYYISFVCFMSHTILHNINTIYIQNRK